MSKKLRRQLSPFKALGVKKTYAKDNAVKENIKNFLYVLWYTPG